MKLYTKKQLYIDNINKENFSYYQEFENGLIISSEVVFYYKEYAQYQATLIKETLEEFEIEAKSSKFSIIKFKSYFELALQELNSKLAVFADKLRLYHKIEIRWFVEFYMDNYYVSSLIGDSSLVIFRNNELFYALHNDATVNKKIDLFAELVEWDLNNGDEILYFWNNISYFTDSEDFGYIAEINGTDERTLIQIIEDTLTERTDLGSINLINLTIVHLEKKAFAIPRGNKVSDMIDHIGYWFKKRRYMASIIGFAIIIFWLTTLLVTNFIQTKTGIKLTATSWETQEYFSLAGIKKEIEEFKALDPSAPEKYNMYKNLEEKIDQLEREWKLPLDIKQLKNMLVSEYQQWFNIETIDALEDRTLSFNSSDLLDIGTPIQVFAGKQLSVAGSAWAIIGASSNEVRGITQKMGLDTKILGCSPNLQANWLLCFDNNNTIYNLTRQTIQTASIGSGSFEKQIKQIGIFWNSNMYLLVENPVLNAAGTFVIRYPLIPGSKEAFKTPINYSFASDVPGDVNSMVIDGSFLLRSSKDKALYQLRRDGTESKSRKINMLWGKELYAASSSGMKVITNPNSNLVYFYEPIKKILLVYKSNPNKTSDGSKYSYSLKYFFAIQLPQTEILDVTISDSSKPQLYVLNTQGIANIKLYDYIESFEAVVKSNEQAKAVQQP